MVVLNSRWQRSFTIIIVFFVLIFFSVAAYYLVFRQTKSNETAYLSAISYTGKERVFIANLADYTDIETKKSVEQALYESIDKDQPDLYTGTIRENSLSEQKFSSGQTMSTLLVDIQPNNVTYKVTLFSSLTGGRPSVNIDCAPQELQKDESITCRDNHFHE